MTGLRHSNRSRFLLGVALVALSALASGCGPAGLSHSSSSSSGDSASGASAACNLFTDAEITTAAGRPFSKHDGVDSTLLGQSICTYQGTDLSTPIQVSIFYNSKAMQLDLLNENSAEHIAGLGDDAFWQPTLVSMFVRKGDHGMHIISVNSSLLGDGEKSTLRDSFRALAEKALPKI
ncbi:MAG: hypothetical protein ACR2MY_12815 [Candidatus Dormibacteria bacterium]